MKQHTLNSACQFHGKGLHTGRIAEMTVKPAPENTGIVFLRKDVGTEAFVKALAENVSNTARSTTIGRRNFGLYYRTYNVGIDRNGH